MPARPQDAAPFHALHRDFLLLPNAWDAASALITVARGGQGDRDIERGVGVGARVRRRT